jgi:ABC-type Fe3+ transport system substrate-binding protein
MRKRFATVVAAFMMSLVQARAADDALIAAAQREGELTWYTTQLVPMAEAMAAAFTAKYGVKVQHARYSPGDIALRIRNEGKAGRMLSDVFDGTEGVSILKKEGLVIAWRPPSGARLPQQFTDPDGYWTATNLFVLSPAFNADLVTPGTEPRTLEDLLDPRWKGRMAMSSTPGIAGGPGFIEVALRAFGEDKGMAYLAKLAAQDVAPVGGSPATLSRVMTGESAIGLQLFVTQVAAAAAKGAPVRTIPLSPALAVYSVVCLTKGGRHPNAAKLFVDFVVSPEGQAIYRQQGYINVDPDLPPLDPTLRPDGVRQRAIYISPDDIAELMPRLNGLHAQLFR